MRRALLLFAAFLALPLPAAEITLTTPTGDLHGTLLVPQTTAPPNVVLIIAGSGPTDRDGNSVGAAGRNDALKMLAEALLARGIASVRYDKRGVAASAPAAPSESDLRFDTYVEDAAAWLHMLVADPRFSEVAVAGHSEGALIGTLAAQQVAIDRVISIAGAGRPAGEVLLEQLERQLTGSLLDASRAIIASLNAGNIYPNPPSALSSLFRPSVQPYLISWFRYDPAAELAKLTVPVLIVQGTTDIQVAVIDAQRLAAAKPAAPLVIINGMNHVLKDVPDDLEAQARSYTDPTLPIDATLPNVIGTFIEHKARRRVARH
jgi:pimeloyl-ACP methyl ester carboxylesterase